jgi:hypothetical protein
MRRASPAGGFVDGLRRRHRPASEPEGASHEQREIALRPPSVHALDLRSEPQRPTPAGQEPVEREPALPRGEVLGAGCLDAVVARGEVAQAEHGSREVEAVGEPAGEPVGEERSPRDLSSLLQAAPDERERHAHRGPGDARDHRVRELAARVETDDAVARGERDAVAQDVGHRERGGAARRQDACAPGERRVAFETDDGQSDALGELAREVSVPGADVEHTGGVSGEGGDQAPECVDLGALARCLTPLGRSERARSHGERRDSAHVGCPLDERAQARRRAPGPGSVMATRLDGRQLLVLERSEERVPAPRDERSRRSHVVSARACVDEVAVLGDEPRSRLPPGPDVGARSDHDEPRVRRRAIRRRVPHATATTSASPIPTPIHTSAGAALSTSKTRWPK